MPRPYLIQYNEADEKWCKKCDRFLPVTEFAKHSSRPDGLQIYCRECLHSYASDGYNKVRIVYDSIGNRLCKKCKQFLPVDKFWRCPGNSDGLQSWCKTCTRASNPEYRKNYNKQYAETHREQMHVYAQRWYTNHPEHAKEYRMRRPEVHVSARHRRRARIAGNGGIVTSEELKALFEFYEYTCLACGMNGPDIKLEPDHIIPISLGGLNIIENLQPLCEKCNERKHTKIIDYRELWERTKEGKLCKKAVA